jgi:hypothetical protein
MPSTTILPDGVKGAKTQLPVVSVMDVIVGAFVSASGVMSVSPTRTRCRNDATVLNKEHMLCRNVQGGGVCLESKKLSKRIKVSLSYWRSNARFTG